MAGVEDEPGGTGDRIDEFPRFLLRHRQRPPTSKTDQMLMTRVLGEVINRRAMPEMRVGEKTGVFESLHRAVDRGAIETGACLGSCLVIDVRRAEMLVVGGGDHLADRPASVGDPVSLGAERSDQLVGSDVHEHRLCDSND